MKVRPPITQGMGIATNMMMEMRESSVAPLDKEILAAMLYALVGIGEMLHEMRPDIDVQDPK